MFRDQSGKATLEFIEAVTAELGYVLCHVAAICQELNVRVSEVARKNMEKLHLGKLRAVDRGQGITYNLVCLIIKSQLHGLVGARLAW